MTGKPARKAAKSSSRPGIGFDDGVAVNTVINHRSSLRIASRR